MNLFMQCLLPKFYCIKGLMTKRYKLGQCVLNKKAGKNRLFYDFFRLKLFFLLQNALQIYDIGYNAILHFLRLL